MPSMGSVGDAYDNAMAESFFATLRAELVDDVLQPRVERGGHGLSPWVMGTRTLFPHSVQDPS